MLRIIYTLKKLILKIFFLLSNITTKYYKFKKIRFRCRTKSELGFDFG